MTTYPHVEHYHEELRQLIEFGGSDNEQSIRRAFESCLDSYRREHREKMEPMGIGLWQSPRGFTRVCPTRDRGRR